MTAEVQDQSNPLYPPTPGITASARKQQFDTARFLDVRNLGLRNYKKDDGEPLLGFNESLGQRDAIKKTILDYELAKGLIQPDALGAQPAAASPMNGVQPTTSNTQGAPQMTQPQQPMMPFMGGAPTQQQPQMPAATPQQMAAVPQPQGMMPQPQMPQQMVPQPQMPMPQQQMAPQQPMYGQPPQGYAPPPQPQQHMMQVPLPPQPQPTAGVPQQEVPEEQAQPAKPAKGIRRPKNSGAAVAPPPPPPPSAPEQQQAVQQPMFPMQGMQQPQQGYQAPGFQPGQLPPGAQMPPPGYGAAQGMPMPQQPAQAPQQPFPVQPQPQVPAGAPVDLGPVNARLDQFGKGFEVLSKQNEALAGQLASVSQQLVMVGYHNKMLLAVLHHLYLTHPQLGPGAAQAQTLDQFMEFLTRFVGPVPK